MIKTVFGAHVFCATPDHVMDWKIHLPNEQESDLAELYRLDAEYAFNRIKSIFLKRKTTSRAVASHSKASRLNGLAILIAHGTSYRGEWLYQDSGKFYPVQDWISSHDGVVAALLIQCCNEGNHPITARHSIVVHPSCIASLKQIKTHPRRLRLFIPKYGYQC